MKLTSLIVIFILLINSTYIFACPSGQVKQFGICVYERDPNGDSPRNDILASRECREKPEDEQAQCFRDLAEANSTSDRSGDYDTSGLGEFGMAAVHAGIIFAAAYALNFWLQKKNGKITCGTSGKAPLSMYMLSVGALTLLGAEVYSYIKYSGKLKELDSDLSQFQAPSEDDPDASKDDYYNHLTERAFDAIIKKEEAYLAATKIRKTGYMIATGMFGAAAISSGIEIILNRVKTDGIGDYSCGGDGDSSFHDATSEKAIAKKGSRGSGGGGSMGLLLGFLPMLLGFVTDSGIDMAIPANSFENLNQLKLPNESKRLLSSIQNSESIDEVNMIMKESELLRNGGVSSPSLKDYQIAQSSREFYSDESTTWSQQKEVIMMGALFSSQYEEVGFLFTSDNTVVQN